jgi:hypothetical protein
MRYRMTVVSIIDTKSPNPLRDIDLLRANLMLSPDVVRVRIRRVWWTWRWPSWRLWSWRREL